MADEQDRPLIFDQEAFQQLQRLDVEVVGRLVEHQQVRWLRVNSLASSSRLRSPPESSFTSVRERSGGKRKSCK